MDVVLRPAVTLILLVVVASSGCVFPFTRGKKSLEQVTASRDEPPRSERAAAAAPPQTPPKQRQLPPFARFLGNLFDSGNSVEPDQQSVPPESGQPTPPINATAPLVSSQSLPGRNVPVASSAVPDQLAAPAPAGSAPAGSAPRSSIELGVQPPAEVMSMDEALRRAGIQAKEPTVSLPEVPTATAPLAQTSQEIVNEQRAPQESPTLPSTRPAATAAASEAVDSRSLDKLLEQPLGGSSPVSKPPSSGNLLGEMKAALKTYNEETTEISPPAPNEPVAEASPLTSSPIDAEVAPNAVLPTTGSNTTIFPTRRFNPLRGAPTERTFRTPAIEQRDNPLPHYPSTSVAPPRWSSIEPENEPAVTESSVINTQDQANRAASDEQPQVTVNPYVAESIASADIDLTDSGQPKDIASDQADPAESMPVVEAPRDSATIHFEDSLATKLEAATYQARFDPQGEQSTGSPLSSELPTLMDGNEDSPIRVESRPDGSLQVEAEPSDLSPKIVENPMADSATARDTPQGAVETLKAGTLPEIKTEVPRSEVKPIVVAPITLTPPSGSAREIDQAPQELHPQNETAAIPPSQKSTARIKPVADLAAPAELPPVVKAKQLEPRSRSARVYVIQGDK